MTAGLFNCRFPDEEQNETALSPEAQDIDLECTTFYDQSSDDSFSSSFEDSESDSLDEFYMRKNYLSKEVTSDCKRIQFLDPVTEKLQNFLDADLLPRESMFYILLKSSLTYVNWLVERQKNHSLQFEWDKEVLQFVESLEYHGSRKVVNLLRGPGHDGEGARVFLCIPDWVKWNWPLPGKTTRDKMYSGYSTENGILAPFLESFLQLASTSDGGILTLFEDKSVKVIPVMLAKDGMQQLKPGLLYDSKQGKLIGSTLNLSYNYIKQGEPDRELIKSSIVQEAEVLCLTTADSKFSLPVGVNHLSKGLTAAETLEIIKKK